MKFQHFPRLGLVLSLALAAAGVSAAAPDWSKTPSKKITVFYPGVSPIEWIVIGSEHGGARAMKKGETCASCHDAEAADMGKKMVTGQKAGAIGHQGQGGLYSRHGASRQ